MDTATFLRRITGGGMVVLAIKQGKFWKHFAYEGPDEAAKGALAHDANGVNVFHANATYKLPFIVVDGKEKTRHVDNVAKVKSLWLDLDCGEGKDYWDQTTALLDLDRFVVESGLPAPLVVSSGNGLHCYWVFTSAVTPSLWTKLATRFHAVVDHYGVKQDPTCTSDINRVLRPVGTHNRKKEPLLVELLRDAEATDPVVIAKLLMAAPVAAPEPESVLPAHLQGLFAAKGDMAIKVDYPPSSAHEIRKRCAQVDVFAEMQGAVSEPMWYGMLGLLKFTTEGEEICQEWSKGHPAYDPDATSKKIIQWQQGPTTCDHFIKLNPDRCEGCPHRGSIKSPIALGHTLPEPAKVEVPTEVEGETIEFKMPEDMQGHFSWDGTNLYVMTADKKGRPQVIPFCDYLFWPMNYHRVDNKSKMVWRLLEPLGRVHDFELTGSAISTGGVALFAELGQNGIVAKAGQKTHMEAYITTWFNEKKKEAEETVVYQHFGWQDDMSFVIGRTRLAANEEPTQIKLSGDASMPTYADAFEPAGTLDAWRSLVDAAYNYPGQEQYQFMMGFGFGAPLVRLFENYGGVTLNGYSPERGLGKSTALKMALGIFGNPKLLVRTKQQVTPKAYISHCGVMHSLPVGLDEATNIDPKELSDMVYIFSQGTNRIILDREGKMRSPQHSWSTIQGLTANRSLVGLMGAAKANAEAEMGRMIEFQFEQVSRFSKVEADTLLAKAEVLYGHAGKVFAQYVVDNREAVTQLLRKMQTRVDAVCGYTVQDRFASIGITAIVVGIFIANQLKLTAFDIAKLLEWIGRRAGELKVVMESNSPPVHDVFGRMLTEVAHGLIVTSTEGDARNSNRIAVVHQTPNGAISGRLIQDVGVLYIQQTVIRQWCAKHQADYADMWRVVVEKGWAHPEVVTYSLGKGTREYGLAPTRCWKIDVAKMNGEELRPVTALKAVK